MATIHSTFPSWPSAPESRRSLGKERNIRSGEVSWRSPPGAAARTDVRRWSLLGTGSACVRRIWRSKRLEKSGLPQRCPSLDHLIPCTASKPDAFPLEIYIQQLLQSDLFGVPTSPNKLLQAFL